MQRGVMKHTRNSQLLVRDSTQIERMALRLAVLALTAFTTLTNAELIRIGLKKAPLSPASERNPSRLQGLLNASNGKGNVPITNFLDAQVCASTIMHQATHVTV
jgi:hypothetical protein